jgi:hypothetical protein
VSTYTIAYASMGICLLQLEKYQDAFNAFKRARSCCPRTTTISPGNKTFLKRNLEDFDKEGDKWRKTGTIGIEQKEELKSLIKSFESNFNKLYTG